MDGDGTSAGKAETLTNPNRRRGAAGRGADAPALRQALLALDPLCEPPDASGLLPPDDSPPPRADGGTERDGRRERRGEPGSRPLENRRREQFCRVLTGWGGDGVRKTNCEAYSKVYGRSGATARTQSSWLMSVPEVRERVEWLERRVDEARRHDYLSAQREIDELRLSLVERARHNSKLAAVALAAARDFEAAHGLDGRGFTYRPMAVLRQSVAGSAYGKGIGEKTLADCRELQELEECELRMVANESTPAVLAPSSMKGRAINMFPGGVTYYDGMLGGGAAPVTRLFETREGIDKVEMKIQAVTDRIRRFWYNDLFAMMLTVSQGGRTHRTATEVSELAGEKVTLLGPVLTQMDDFLTAAVDATLTILMEDGVVPPPPDALARSGGAVSVEYTSTIHAEMKAALRMRAINSLVEMTSMLAQASPETLDKMDSDAIVDEVSRTYPGAAAFVRDAKAVAAIRAERQDAQAEREREARTVEMMKNAGANAKALSEAKTGNGSALELLMAGGAA